MKLHLLILACSLLPFATMRLARADVIPPNLPAGSEYELAFVTRDTRNATSPYIADYNSFVTSEAAQNSSLPLGVTWDAIASAAGDIHGIGMADADQNAPVTSSIPVYNTAGQLVANAATPLYSASGILINPIDYDQFGNALAGGVWTGSNTDGTSDKPLGGQQFYGAPDTGYSTNTNSQWIHNGDQSQVAPMVFYALSSPITVVPEPGTLVLLAAGVVAAAAYAWRRRVCGLAQAL